MVLINGRRAAPVAGQEDFATNLRLIPAAAIERIDINLDGGSAIYGSDAVGGVINIILKEDYTGYSLTARYENSSTGGHLKRINGYGGYNWSSGSLSGSFYFDEQDPVSSRSAGFVTLEYRDDYPEHPFSDQRQFDRFRSGAVDPFPNPFFVSPSLILPSGQDGTGAIEADFIPLDPDLDNIDSPPSDLTDGSENIALTIAYMQDITSKLKLSADLVYLETKTSRQAESLISPNEYYVPESNAFNPFGRDVSVLYYPTEEIRTGLVNTDQLDFPIESLSVGLELEYSFNDSHKMTASYSRSRSVGDGSLSNVLGIPQFRRDFSIPDEVYARLEDILASPDPTVAINLFGDGSAQNSTFSEFVEAAPSFNPETIIQDGEAYLAGYLYNIPGGRVEYSVGGEARRESLRGFVLNQSFGGVPDPDRDVYALFSELYFPIIGDRNTKAWAKALDLDIDLRYDSYSVEGALGTDPDTGDPVIVEATFDHLSPRIGLAWTPQDSLTLRASWSQAFRAPITSQLLSTVGLSTTLGAFDPISFEFIPSAVSVFGPNPD